ncbi:MAG: hypothetical protein HYS58_04005 [Elusimicrobia bacterium]|nr:hypothetical protein [Elusimicrobiota bacterium]
MTVVARRFVAAPVRTATQVWMEIVALIAVEGSDARNELNRVGGIVASLIADECPEEAPFVVAGNGPRLRVYCLYGEDALLGEDRDESPLTWIPTEGDWEMYVPCRSEDLDWVKESLGRLSARVFPYDLLREDKEPDKNPKEENSKLNLSVNVEGFKRL